MSGLSKIYTKKQLEIYKRTLTSDWFMLINHGAKRSGKTVLNNDLFLQELLRVKKIAKAEGVANPMYILAGDSIASIYQNILKELTNKYGLQFKFDRFNNFYLFGVYVVQVGHGTISGLGKIRGMTAYGAYINEGTLANEEVFDEIKARCSGYGARILIDTNPADPEHWLLKDYIETADEKTLVYHFTLFDNTFMNERYINNIVATTPPGVFTDRNIYGLWVSGKGAIYSCFDKEKHFVRAEDIDHDKFKYYVAGVDWGYSHYGAIVVAGVADDNKYYIVEEHAVQFKNIDYWVSVAKDIARRYGANIPFYCDSARPEYVARFAEEGLNAINAVKRIMEGVELVATLFMNDKLFVIDTVSRFRAEVYKYVWDKKTGLPVKKDDDVMDAIRYMILTNEVIQKEDRPNLSGKGARI